MPKAMASTSSPGHRLSICSVNNSGIKAAAVLPRFAQLCGTYLGQP